jgi:hypothetical protein
MPDDFHGKETPIQKTNIELQNRADKRQLNRTPKESASKNRADIPTGEQPG